MSQDRPVPAWISRCYLALFALLPWSLEYSFGSWKINLLSEPLIAVTGILSGWHVLKNPAALRNAVFGNMVLLPGALWVGWLGISACFSSMPVVSWKYWIVEAGHWWVFAAGLTLFPALWRPAFRLFALSMAGVVAYTLIHHSFYHFRSDQALLAPMPFFPENTLYAAVVAMVLTGIHSDPALTFSLKPAAARFWGDKRYAGKILLHALLVTGFFFAFCRGAWLSVLIAGAMGLALVFDKKKAFFVLAGLTLVFAGLYIFDPTYTGITKDVSMLERFNRHACAARMVTDRPLTGFGPGTFQFQYVPYQHPEEMTRISVKVPVAERSPETYGRGGGAHSEYYQALAETGWPGFLLWSGLTLFVLWTGFRKYFLEKTKENQWFALALTLSLLTFFLHGLFNNLLHDGRMAALVWGMVCSGGDGSSANRSFKSPSA